MAVTAVMAGMAVVAGRACSPCAAQMSYLTSNERIVCVGDSIMAAGLSLTFVEQVLHALYPDAGIRLHNLGQGGASAPAGASSLAGYLDKHEPTLATFMFGVNDTRWSEGQAEEKIGRFLGGLEKAVASTAAKQIPLVLLRESHFSHGADPPPDAFESQVNRTLFQLLAAQDRFAAEHRVPVVDVLGAYQRQLAAAWAKDPREHLAAHRAAAVGRTGHGLFHAGDRQRGFQGPPHRTVLPHLPRGAGADELPPARRHGGGGVLPHRILTSAVRSAAAWSVDRPSAVE